MQNAIDSMEFANKLGLAYGRMCKPLCQKLGLPQTAFDILMFLANNPAYKTASDIVEVRHIKANLVSVNVDRLVQEGLLERCAVPEDRRKTGLVCTEKAKPFIAQGKALQQQFFRRMLEGIGEAQLQAFNDTIGQMGANLDEMLKENA